MGGRGSSASRNSNSNSLSPAAFETYVLKNDTEVMYRGYSAASQEELETRTYEMLTGTHRLSGNKTSATGRGLYFASTEVEANSYAIRRAGEQGHGYKNVIVATLAKDAKIANQDTLNKLYTQQNEEAGKLLQQAFSSGISQSEARKLGDQSNAIRRMDIGTYALSKGYDAIKTGFGETVVLNQKKIIYKRKKSGGLG